MPTKTYTVEWAENKPTSTGKDRKIITIKDETGAHYENVTMWSDFPSFADIGPGSTVQGDYKDDGKYRTLFPVRAPRAAGGGTGGNMRGVAAAQQRKVEGIEKAQGRKETGIMISAAFRDATILVQASGLKFETDEEMWEKHKEYRNFYIKQWLQEEKSQDIPF